MSERLELILTPAHLGRTVGQILRQDLGLSSSVIKRIKWREEGILLDGQPVTTRGQGQPGQILSALIGEDRATPTVSPVAGPLDILFEDGHCLVVNKAPGVAVHPTFGHKEDTLGNFLLHHYQSQGEGCGFHPVHRLDIGTSGLLLVAKHPHAQERLSRQFHSQDFLRDYWALIQGHLPQAQGTISQPILQIQGGIRRQVHPEGQPSTTHYQSLSQVHYQGQLLSLLELRLLTGRTHQIRVHLSHLGHPLVGDGLYGGCDLLPRPALHARYLAFRHPVTGDYLTFQVDPPQDMKELLAKA